MYKKLCLNLCSLKWLRPTRRRVRKISPLGWLTLTTSLLRGLVKFKIFFLKAEYEGELRISESNLLHSTNADEKNELRKKLFLTLNWEITKFWLFLVWYELLFEGIKSNKYLGTVLWQFYKRLKVFEAIVYLEETLILPLEKASQ